MYYRRTKGMEAIPVFAGITLKIFIYHIALRWDDISILNRIMTFKLQCKYRNNWPNTPN